MLQQIISKKYSISGFFVKRRLKVEERQTKVNAEDEGIKKVLRVKVEKFDEDEKVHCNRTKLS